MRWTLPVLLAACVPPLPEADPASAPLAPGESREVTLRALSLDVRGFSERVDLDRLRAMPQPVLDRLWLLDLGLGPLATNALQQLRDLSDREARALSPTGQSMWTLLNTTADNVTLTGTSMEELVAVAGAIGIPPARALSQILQTEPTEPVLPLGDVVDVVVEQVVATHPATQVRRGPPTPERPDGVYPVAPASLPISLGDVVTDFASLPDRFGPADTPLGRHPGFIDAAEGVTVLEPDFALTVRVDLNALPYRGLDLTDASDAAVNSTRSQIATLFRTSDPDWLRIEGLRANPTVGSLTLRVEEDAAFHLAGATVDPAPRGASTVWDLPPWAFERVAAEASFRALSANAPGCTTYDLASGARAFDACVDAAGWAVFETFAGLGNPPDPLYLWDLVSEVAQVRLHDGGLAEGTAHVTFTLRDVPLGIDGDTLGATVAANLAADPGALEELAAVLTENSQGAADVMYVRADGEDQLWFVHPQDIPPGDTGAPARAYTYANPGFYADEALTERVSSPFSDTPHERVRVAPGDRLFVEDDDGAVFSLTVSAKPSDARLAVTVRRVR